jgi:hypothetical protein
MMTNITIGGVYHAKVFGADTPGPIWKTAMSGALAGQSSANLPTVAIADPSQDNKGGGNNNGGTTGTTTSAGGTTAGPNPTFSFPNIIGGNGNGGSHGRGGGNGG